MSSDRITAKKKDRRTAELMTLKEVMEEFPLTPEQVVSNIESGDLPIVTYHNRVYAFRLDAFVCSYVDHLPHKDEG